MDAGKSLHCMWPLLLAGLVAAVLAGTAEAAVYYAAPAATGAGDGSSPENRCTLAYARTHFGGCDTVLLADGTYSQYDEHGSEAVARTDWYTLKAEHPGDATVQGVLVGTTGTKYDAYLRLEGLVLYAASSLPDSLELEKVGRVHAKGCTFIGRGWGPGAGSTSYVLPENRYASLGVKASGAPEHITLEDCVFRPPVAGELDDPAVMHTGFSRGWLGYGNNVTFTGCEFVNCEIAICGTGNNWLIEDTRIHDCYSDGIMTHGGDGWVIRDTRIEQIYGDKCNWCDMTFQGYYKADTDILTKTAGDPFLLLLRNCDSRITVSWNGGANSSMVESHRLETNSQTVIDYAAAYPLHSADIGSAAAPVEFRLRAAHKYHEDSIQWYAISGGPDWNNPLIERCVLSGSGGQGIICNKDTSYAGRVKNLTMRNCVMTDTDAYTATFQYTDNTVLEHCTIYNHRNGEDRTSLHFYGTNTNPTIRYCLISYPCGDFSSFTTYSVGYGHLNWGFPGETNEDLGLGATGLQNFKNCLVDYDNFGYELAPDAPAVNFCTPSPVTRDVLNKVRDTAPDAGAFEHGGAATQTWSVVTTHSGATVVTGVPEGYVEPRAAGIATLRVAFNRPFDPETAVAGAIAIAGQTTGDQAGRIASVTPAPDSLSIDIVFTSALPDGDRYTVTVTDVLKDPDGEPMNDGMSRRFSALVGDVDGSGKVSAADVVAVRDRAGSPVDAATGRYDVDTSGAVTGGDMATVRARLGRALP